MWEFGCLYALVQIDALLIRYSEFFFIMFGHIGMKTGHGLQKKKTSTKLMQLTTIYRRPSYFSNEFEYLTIFFYYV